jgi:hypothetical protein
MGILLFLIGGAITGLLLLGIAMRIAQALGFVALCIIGVAFIAIGYISIAVAGISLAALYQLWGSDNFGWAIAAAGIVGLFVALAMAQAVLAEIKKAAENLKRWFGFG